MFSLFESKKKISMNNKTTVVDSPQNETDLEDGEIESDDDNINTTTASASIKNNVNDSLIHTSNASLTIPECEKLIQTTKSSNNPKTNALSKHHKTSADSNSSSLALAPTKSLSTTTTTKNGSEKKEKTLSTTSKRNDDRVDGKHELYFIQNLNYF